MICLRKANTADADKEWLFQRAIPEDENGFLNDMYDISREGFTDALDMMIAQSAGMMLPAGWVPQTVYYLWVDDTIVGTFHFRHYLSRALAEGSGHIGYYIAPEFRGKGYGTLGLKMLIDEIYLRVNRDNPASLRVMLNNGGYIHHDDELHYYVRIKL